MNHTRIEKATAVYSVSVLLACACAFAGPTIQDLGVLPGGGGAAAYGVSADGNVVAGTSGSANGPRAFRWTTTGGLQDLGVLTNISNSAASYGNAISADGQWVVGTSIDTGAPAVVQAFRWSNGVGMQSVPGSITSYGHGASADGAVVVGSAELPGGFPAFRWSSGLGMQNLGSLMNGFIATGLACSADGSVVVGESQLDFGHGEGSQEPFRWTAASGMVSLGTLGGTGVARGVSSNGAIVVGSSYTSTGNERAFRWTATGGMENLGVPPGQASSFANAVNADGTVIGGASVSFLGFTRACVWTPSGGAIDLKDFLISKGLDLTDWSLTEVTGVSADGTRLVGFGSHNGSVRAWLVMCAPLRTAECPGDANSDGTVDFGDISSILTNWGADYCAQAGAGDANADGVVDFVDINAVYANWGAVCEQ